MPLDQELRDRVQRLNQQRAEVGWYCGCGCETRIHRGDFVRGHAVGHSQRLRARAVAGDIDARQELLSRGWRSHQGPVTDYGLEAEFTGCTSSEAVQALRDAGITAHNDGYHHETRDYWRITSDSSVTGYDGDGEDNYGNELVSPILNVGEASFGDIEHATAALRNAGGRIDRSCGLHIHHSAAALTTDMLAETITHWVAFQPVINQMLPSSRRESDMCMPLTPDEHRSWMRIIGTESIQNVKGRGWPRYYAVNLDALSKHDTLEFRQHSGTLNPEKITNWIQFTKLFMDIGKRHKVEDLVQCYGGFDAVAESFGVRDMILYLGGGAKLAKFYEDREQSLGNGTDREDNAADEWDSEMRDRNEDYGDDPDQEWCADCGAFH